MFRTNFKINCFILLLDDNHSTFEKLQVDLDSNLISEFDDNDPLFIRSLLIDLLSSSTPNRTNEPNAIINARRLYASCLNEEATETEGVDILISLINTQFGGWPILQGSSWDNSTFNFARLLIKMNEYGNNVIYAVGTTTNDKNSSAYIVHVRRLVIEV